MKKIKPVLLFFATLFSLSAVSQTSGFYSFKVKTLEGDDFDFSTLKGKKVMIVNTASQCGNTPQYSDLEKIYTEYGDHFVIIGFPANNFGSQEPGNAKEIREFCTQNYGITFPLMQKISVKGEDMAPVYKWLTSKKENGVMDSQVTWNFQKYLIDEKGNLVSVMDPKERVTSDKVIAWITANK